jgi:ATP-dependent DNA helicase RecG
MIQNAGGPDRSVKIEDIRQGNPRPKRYRNRRLGDFLKELHLTEGHATGIALILKSLAQNGSPTPEFEIGEDGTDFAVTFFRHKAFENESVFQGIPIIELERLVSKISTTSREILLNLFENTLVQRQEILEKVGLANQPKKFQRHLNTLLAYGLVIATRTNKAQVASQKYSLTSIGAMCVQYLQKTAHAIPFFYFLSS